MCAVNWIHGWTFLKSHAGSLICMRSIVEPCARKNIDATQSKMWSDDQKLVSPILADQSIFALISVVSSIAVYSFSPAAVLSPFVFYDRHSLRVIALLFSNHDWGDIRGPCCDGTAQTSTILPKTDFSASNTPQAPQVKPYSCSISSTLLTF